MKIDDVSMISYLKQMGGKQHSDELHLFKCPFCNTTHPRNPALSVNTKRMVFYAHCCGQSGHISKLFKKMTGGY